MAKSIVLWPPVAAVGIEDRLPQRAGAGIGRGGDNENSVREETLGLDGPGTVRLGIQAQRRVAVVTRRRREAQPVQGRVERRESSPIMQRAGPIAQADQAVGPREQERPGRDREVRSQAGSSGPASVSWSAMPSPEAVEKSSRLTGNPANCLCGRLERGRT